MAAPLPLLRGPHGQPPVGQSVLQLKKGCRGFTMIELLVALTIFAAMSVFIFTTAGGFARGKKLLDERRSLELLSEEVLFRLTSEAASLYNGDGLRLLPLPGTTSSSASSSATSTGTGSISSVFRLEPSERGGHDQDSVSFILEKGGQFLPESNGNQQSVQITYRLVDDPASPTGSSLIREEIPLISPPDAAYEKKMVFPITNLIRSFRCRVFDRERQQWDSSWGNVPQKTGTPNLLEFQVTLVTPSGLSTTYTTGIPLPPS